MRSVKVVVFSSFHWVRAPHEVCDRGDSAVIVNGSRTERPLEIHQQIEMQRGQSMQTSPRRCRIWKAFRVDRLNRDAGSV
jgi:hypothetical protein